MHVGLVEMTVTLDLTPPSASLGYLEVTKARNMKMSPCNAQVIRSQASG